MENEDRCCKGNLNKNTREVRSLAIEKERQRKTAERKGVVTKLRTRNGVRNF